MYLSTKPPQTNDLLQEEHNELQINNIDQFSEKNAHNI